MFSQCPNFGLIVSDIIVAVGVALSDNGYCWPKPMGFAEQNVDSLHKSYRFCFARSDLPAGV